MVSSGKHRRSRVHRLSSAMILCGESRVVAAGWCGPCGKPQLEVGLDHLGLEYVFGLVQRRGLRINVEFDKSTYADDRIMPTVPRCASFWSARSASTSLSSRRRVAHGF